MNNTTAINWNEIPDIITKDQLYRICHISKKTARRLLITGAIPCVYTGKKTRCFQIKKEDAYTSTQYAYALYPEYGYQFGANKCTTLYLNDYQWCFNKLNYTKTNKAYHYTPLYFPGGQYIVKVVKSDMWTPSGMIQSIDTTKPITISGNAYDDWYIGRE